MYLPSNPKDNKGRGGGTLIVRYASCVCGGGGGGGGGGTRRNISNSVVALRAYLIQIDIVKPWRRTCDRCPPNVKLSSCCLYSLFPLCLYSLFPLCVVFFIPSLSTGPVTSLLTGTLCHIPYSIPIDRTRDVSYSLIHPYRQDP